MSLPKITIKTLLQDYPMKNDLKRKHTIRQVNHYFWNKLIMND